MVKKDLFHARSQINNVKTFINQRKPNTVTGKGNFSMRQLVSSYAEENSGDTSKMFQRYDNEKYEKLSNKSQLQCLLRGLITNSILSTVTSAGLPVSFKIWKSETVKSQKLEVTLYS